MTKQKSVSVAIKADGGVVVLKFDRDVSYLELEPNNCLNITEAMAAAAFECQNDGIKPVGSALKADLVQRHREILVPRIALMLTGMRQDRLKTDGYIAEQLVSTMLAEVF